MSQARDIADNATVTTISGNAGTATALQNARTIGGTSFDGTANIAVGLAGTATALATARTIGGTSFDGTANIAVGLAGTATALATARTIHGVSFDGTANIDLSEVIQDTVGAMFSSNTETDITATYEDGDGTIDLVVGAISGNAATATALQNARTIGGTSFDGTANITPANATLAATATALATARTIGGTSFDGTANITPANATLAATATALATARTISLSSDVTGSVSFDGTGNADIACTVADNSHNHTPANCGLGNLSSSGNALSGNFTATGNITAYSDSRLKDNVVTIPDALDKVKQLNGYTYTRTDGHSGSHTGVFAQEVLKVLPEAVLQGKRPEDHMSVAYGNMMGLVIEALKEMEMKIQKLEEK